MVRKTKAMVAFKDQAKERAQKQRKAADVVSSNVISVQGGEMKLNGNKLPDPFNCVILNQCLEYSYYDKEWTPDSKDMPVCFAISKPISQMDGEKMDSGLAPHDKSSLKQSTDCASCQHNKFGSATKGEGKACGNRKRLLLLPADQIATSTELAILPIPPTSLTPFAKYSEYLNRVEEVPTEFAITKISMQKTDEKAVQKIPVFEFGGFIEQNQVAVIDELIENNIEMLVKPFDRPAATAQAAKKKAAPRKKAPVRKKAPTRRAKK